jgi:hypothetical protein
MKSIIGESPAPTEPLGHGDHWRALGFGDGEIVPFIQSLADCSDFESVYHAPWPGAGFSNLAIFKWPQASLTFTTLFGISPRTNSLDLLSAFPVPTKTVEWLVRVDEIRPCYGPYEGVVTGTTVTGHQLQWFDPGFHRDKSCWQPGTLTRVAFSAIALRIGRYPGEPIVVTEGALLESYREELRGAGKHAEAGHPDLSVTVETHRLRTFFSSYHDHHQYVAKILSATRIRPLPQCTGWRLEIECLPDSPACGSTMVLFAFTPSLEAGYIPRKGDLIHGIAWLQGRWHAETSPKDQILWHEESQHAPPPTPEIPAARNAEMNG